jgi:hypothetical protein
MPLRLFFTALWCALFGCLLSQTPPTPIPTPTAAPIPTAEPAAADWRALAPGLEQRSYRPGGSLFGQLYVLRIDPALYRFQVHYRPGSPLAISGWERELPAATSFVNANFFDPNHVILGLLVADGVVFGQSYQGRGGMFQVQNGQPRVRSLIAEPYAGEPLEQAVQAFPMLVQNGQAAYTPAAQERVSRRTVVAQDSQGRILLMVTPLTGLTLEDLSQYLPTTDMQLVNALNLDGGGSTMLYVRPAGGQPERLPSLDPVPAVLAVYPR